MPSSKRTKKISLTKVCGGAARGACVRYFCCCRMCMLDTSAHFRLAFVHELV